jgi:hypothetical protein
VHQVRYAGGLAAHRKLRGASTPTPRQPGIEAQASPASSRFGWVRLLKRVFSIDLERCPRGHLGAWRIIAALPSRPLIRRILRHLKLAVNPPSRPNASTGFAGASRNLIGADSRTLPAQLSLDDARGQAEKSALEFLSVGIPMFFEDLSVYIGIFNY